MILSVMQGDELPPYFVRIDDDVVEAWSSLRLAFEPKGWQVNFRAELRAALSGLRSPGPGEVLVAEYAAVDSGQLVDAENVLLYNVGGPMGRLCRSGIRFERSFAPPLAPGLQQFAHYVRYGIGPVGAEFRSWRKTTLIADVALAFAGAIPTRPADVWWQMRQQSPRPAEAAGRPSRFAVRLLVDRPGLNIGAVIKPLIDGIVSAFHAHDGFEAPAVAARLAAAGVGNPVELMRMLGDPAWAALGVRRLVRPYRSGGVQWNPADEYLVACDISSSPTSTSSGPIRISGSIGMVDPTLD
jgi:hypothetical protein